MTRTLSIGNDRLLESSLSTFDGRSAPASRKTATRPTCRRAVPCLRMPQLVRPTPRLFRRGGGRQPGSRACRSPGAHGERRAPVARPRARDLPGRRRAIPRGRRRPPNRPVFAARPESGCATLAHCSLLIAHCSLLIAHCSSGGSLKLRHVLALAQRLLACESPGPTLPLGPERTVLVRSMSSGSVGGAAPYVHHQVAVWAALPLGPRRTVRTATRARAYRLGTFNVEWQCESHCHSALSVQSRAGGTATWP